MHRRRRALTLVELLVVIAIIGVVIALLLPNVRTSRGAARRNHCHNNLKNISLALLRYEEEHGTLPPAYTVDEQGNRLHSWRTLILPYMEQEALYKTIDLTKPWDDPVNDKPRKTVVEAYQCPSSPKLNEMTNYLAVVGPDAAFEKSTPRRLADVKDGAKHTIGLVDVDAEHAVHWMSPEDITAEEVLQIVANGKVNHVNVVLAGFLDGHVRALNIDVDPKVLRSMLTIAGKEKIDD